MKKRRRIMSVHQHKKEAPKQVNCKVITVSDTHSKETDESGASRLSSTGLTGLFYLGLILILFGLLRAFDLI
jgi:hypothetical protein